MILGLQIIAILFALAMIYFALLHHRRGELDRAEIISWVVIWVFALFVIVFPELLRSFARNFFITRLFDLIVVGGFILVISMAVKTYIGTKRMEKKLENYIREVALGNVKKKAKE